MLRAVVAARGYPDMRTACAGRLLLAVAAATLLGACAGNRLSPDAPAGVSLAGAWKLNHAVSDDPQKLLAGMRAEALRRIRRAQAMAGVQRPDTRSGGTSRTASDEPLPDVDPPGPRTAHMDPLQRSPMAHIVFERLARGDFLTVRQGPAEFVLDYGGSQRNFTPGGHSVVSAEGGVGDQTSGWKGREYLIEIKAQLGPHVTERYGLSADGKHLVEKLHIGADELSAVELTRVYDPVSESAPPQRPISD
jgi:hypothetical protein